MTSFPQRAKHMPQAGPITPAPMNEIITFYPLGARRKAPGSRPMRPSNTNVNTLGIWSPSSGFEVFVLGGIGPGLIKRVANSNVSSNLKAILILP